MVVVYGIDLHLSISGTMDDTPPVKPRIYDFVNDLEKLPPLVDSSFWGQKPLETVRKMNVLIKKSTRC
jgi:hypothetical protein